MRNLITEASLDLLLFAPLDGRLPELGQLPCTTAVVYGKGPDGESTGSELPIRRILVPTTGGMDTAHTISLLLPLTPELQITAVYVARRGYAGFAELGRVEHNLERMLNYVGAVERIQTRTVFSDSAISALQREARNYHVLVLSVPPGQPLDHVWFGEAVQDVVDQVARPVAMVQAPQGQFNLFLRRLDWSVQRVMPRLGPRERDETRPTRRRPRHSYPVPRRRLERRSSLIPTG